MRLKNRGQCLLGAHNSETGAQSPLMGAQSPKECAQYMTAPSPSSSPSSSSAPSSERADDQQNANATELLPDHVSVGPLCTSPGEKFNARSYRTRLFEMLPGHARLGPLDVDAAIAEQMRDGDVDGDLIVERTAAFYRSPKGRADVYRNTKPATFIRRGGYLEPDKAWQDPDKSSGGGSTPVYDTSRRDQQRAEDERVMAEREAADGC